MGGEGEAQVLGHGVLLLGCVQDSEEHRVAARNSDCILHLFGIQMEQLAHHRRHDKASLEVHIPAPVFQRVPHGQAISEPGQKLVASDDGRHHLFAR